MAQHAELSSRLDAAESQLHAQPTAAIETAHITLVANVPQLLTDIAVFGQVVAPLTVTAADLAIEHRPLHAPLGGTLLLRLALNSSLFTEQSEKELELSLEAAASAVRVGASLSSSDTAPLPLQVSVRADIPGRCVTVSCIVPNVVPDGAFCVHRSGLHLRDACGGHVRANALHHQLFCDAPCAVAACHA